MGQGALSKSKPAVQFRGRVSGTTHSVPFSHRTNFLCLRRAESHPPTITYAITTNFRLPPTTVTTGEMRQTKLPRLRRAAVRTHAMGDGASGGTWQRAIPPSTPIARASLQTRP